MTSTNKKYNIKTGSISPLDFTLAEGGGSGEGRAVSSKLYYSPKTNGEFTGSNAYLADFSVNETLLPNYVYELAVEFVGPRVWASNGNIPLVFGPDIANATISNSNIIPVRNNVDAARYPFKFKSRFKLVDNPASTYTKINDTLMVSKNKRAHSVTVNNMLTEFSMEQWDFTTVSKKTTDLTFYLSDSIEAFDNTNAISGAVSFGAYSSQCEVIKFTTSNSKDSLSTGTYQRNSFIKISLSAANNEDSLTISSISGSFKSIDSSSNDTYTNSFTYNCNVVVTMANLSTIRIILGSGLATSNSNQIAGDSYCYDLVNSKDRSSEFYLYQKTKDVLSNTSIVSIEHVEYEIPYYNSTFDSSGIATCSQIISPAIIADTSDNTDQSYKAFNEIIGFTLTDNILTGLKIAFNNISLDRSILPTLTQVVDADIHLTLSKYNLLETGSSSSGSTGSSGSSSTISTSTYAKHCGTMPLACATEAINPNKDGSIGEFLTKFTPSVDMLVTKSTLFRIYTLVTDGPPAYTYIAFVLRDSAGGLIANSEPHLLNHSYDLGFFSNSVSTIVSGDSVVLKAGVDYYLGILFQQNYQVFIGTNSNAVASAFSSNLPLTSIIINNLTTMVPATTARVGWDGPDTEETGLRLFIELITP